MVAHMTFTDDIVIIGEASLTKVRNMLTVVDKFYHLSGQRINYPKSQVVCTHNLDPVVAKFLFQHKEF